VAVQELHWNQLLHRHELQYLRRECFLLLELPYWAELTCPPLLSDPFAEIRWLFALASSQHAGKQY
jgi:hypothetical protein